MAGADTSKLVKIEAPGSASSAHPTSDQLAQFPFSLGPLYFHVVPQSFTVSGSANHASQQIVQFGEVSQFGGPALRTVNWDAMFMVRAFHEYTNAGGAVVTYLPQWVQAPFGGLQFYDAYEMIEALEAVRDQGLVMLLTIQDLANNQIDFQHEVTLRNFSYTETGGEIDSKDYSIQFTEYKGVNVRRVDRVGAVPSTTPSRGTRTPKSPYKVKHNGVGIKTIATEVYGQPCAWKAIRDFNGGEAYLKTKFKPKPTWDPKDGDGPFLFQQGSVLKMPKLKGKCH